MTMYENLSNERKRGQLKEEIPLWYTTSGYQMFLEKYQYGQETVRERFQSIARAAARHIPREWGAESEFFNLLWKGWLSPSTPILANMGNDRGLPVSCSGGVIVDSIDGFYSARHENAILTKHGFGTSSYLGNIRPRGSNITIGGKTSGCLPVVKGFVQDMRDVAQGQQRRGAWAGYLPIDHGDFYELVNYILEKPDDLNIGWNVSDEFIAKLNDQDEDALKRFQKALKVKMVTGKGYFSFIDKINAKRPLGYVKNDLYVQASNLCNEITLASDSNHTFTCVLSSMNVSKWEEWKDTKAVFWATVFLDCIASEFIMKAKGIKGLEKAVRFTEKGRALGLGVIGYHTLLLNKRIPFESLTAQWLNREIFLHIDKESYNASSFLGDRLSSPEWCIDGNRNTHRIAIAPTKSTSVLMGGISEGINPDPAMIFNQTSSAGELERINPIFLSVMKEKGKYNKTTIDDIINHFGSIQHVDWLSEEEKQVFRTAFEMDQHVLIRRASDRAEFIDQWQSINLFFPADTPEETIASVHQLAFTNKNILGLYYIYSKSGISGSKETECLACQ